MFEWFSGLFQGGGSSPQTGSPQTGSPQTGTVDPEAGIPISEYTPQGSTDYHSGEGFHNWGNMSKKQYGDLGRAFQAQQVNATIQGGLNAGFNQNWIGQQESAGSAEGQKL